MGRYFINGIDLARYGFIPGHANGNSNIALAGAWSLPSRLGSCYYEWADDEGVDPYVEADDLRFGGRDLELYGTIRCSDREEFLMNLNELYGAFYQFKDLVELRSEDFGSYNVYLKDIVKTTYVKEGWGNIVLKFREPLVDLSGELPAGNLTSGDRIDGIALSALGLTVMEFTEIDNRPATKNANFTAWQHEGFLVTKPKVRTLQLKMLIKAENYDDFRFKIGQYYQLFGGPGVRDVTIHDHTEALFAVNGFAVEDIVIQGEVTGLLKIKLLDGYILNEHILCDDETRITIGDEDNLIIAYYG